MLTILFIAFIQMPALALTPGINQIKTTAFSSYSLGAIQTALAVPGLIQPIAAFSAAILINRLLVTKKTVIIVGLGLLAATGFTALIAHSEFWHLVLLSFMLGVSTGLFISNVFGLIFDVFEPAQRQVVMGWQTSVINAGGIMMSLAGGLLATYMWYGGYIMLLVGLPAAFLVAFTVPKVIRPPAPSAGGGEDIEGAAAGSAGAAAASEAAAKPRRAARLNPGIYYYCAAACIFMMTYSVCGSNLSTHIAGIGNTTTAGIAVAFQMGGGVVSGLFFEKLSKKTGDFSLSFALAAVFAGFFMLSLFPASLVMVFVSVFLVGMALSIMMPRCIFMVSTLSAGGASTATATALVTTVAPSVGVFLSPVIFTNVTTALFGESTSARYSFVGFVVLAFAALNAVVTAARKRGRNE